MGKQWKHDHTRLWVSGRRTTEVNTVPVSPHRTKGAHEQENPSRSTLTLLSWLSCVCEVSVCKVTLSSVSTLFPLEGSHCVRLTSDDWGYVAHSSEFCTGAWSLFIIYLFTDSFYTLLNNLVLLYFF